MTNQIRNVRLKLEMSRLDPKPAAENSSNGDGVDVSAVSTETADAPMEIAAANHFGRETDSAQQAMQLQPHLRRK